MKTIATALELLRAFIEGAEKQSVSELADRFGMERSQVSRMLSTFRDAGWLAQDEKSRAYSVGLTAYVFGSRFLQFHPLTKCALPVLRGVVDKTGFNATLSILDYLKPLYLLSIAGPVPVDLASGFGSYFPFHATAAGKALAAFTDAPIRRQMLAQTPFLPLTSRTLVDPKRIESELDMVYRRGYATSDGERIAGTGALCVPVIGHSGELLAALGIVFPAKMIDTNDYEYHVEILKSSARTVAERVTGTSASMRIRAGARAFLNR